MLGCSGSVYQTAAVWIDHSLGGCGPWQCSVLFSGPARKNCITIKNCRNDLLTRKEKKKKKIMTNWEVETLFLNTFPYLGYSCDNLTDESLGYMEKCLHGKIIQYGWGGLGRAKQHQIAGKNSCPSQVLGGCCPKGSLSLCTLSDMVWFPTKCSGIDPYQAGVEIQRTAELKSRKSHWIAAQKNKG